MLRQTGELLELGKRVQCPVLAIHGDYDPNPSEGVQGPLSSVIRDFRFVLLEECGHLPWIEKKAKGPFFEVLREELGLAESLPDRVYDRGQKADFLWTGPLG